MPDSALTTTRAYRRRLDLTRSVPREVVTACLDIAVHAPSGSNRRAWQFVVVDDPEVRSEIASFYRRGFTENLVGKTPGPAQRADFESAQYLADRLHQVPVLVIACQTGRPPDSAPKLASFYGSIYPAVWSFMVALRARGLGSSLTTAHLAYEREVAALLGIPYGEVTQVALIPLAYLKDDPPSSKPRSAAPLTHWNRWPADDKH
ncbi:nitroreductase family protein [Antrihabitans sp. YC2-6]|nr:nitroreductase family protein [Antrihabitans sp. YC2-6]